MCGQSEDSMLCATVTQGQSSPCCGDKGSPYSHGRLPPPGKSLPEKFPQKEVEPREKNRCLKTVLDSTLSLELQLKWEAV